MGGQLAGAVLVGGARPFATGASKLAKEVQVGHLRDSPRLRSDGETVLEGDEVRSCGLVEPSAP
jgi:hypothetical protein